MYNLDFYPQFTYFAKFKRYFLNKNVFKCLSEFALLMKKFLILMTLIIAIMFLGSSCGGRPKPVVTSEPTPVPRITPNSNSTPTTTTLTLDQISKIAEETTVFITGRGNPGSGVIIGRKDNTYYVLTAAHVVGIKPGVEEPSYELQTKDNHKYTVAKENNYDKEVKKFPEDTDLAVIKFTTESGQEYQVAPLASSVSEEMPVYAFGWTSCLGGNKRTFQQTEGQICGIKTDPNNGWNVSYTNNIIEGVSGGPVFNATGQVVAIQAGQGGNGPTSDDSCQPLPRQPSDNYNHGFGVPIGENIDMLQSKLPYELAIERQATTSAAKEAKVSIQCRQQPQKDKCPIILPPGQRCDSHNEVQR